MICFSPQFKGHGIAERAEDYAEELAEVARDKDSPLRADAARALIGVKLKADVAARVIEQGRPPAKDLDASCTLKLAPMPFFTTLSGPAP